MNRKGAIPRSGTMVEGALIKQGRRYSTYHFVALGNRLWGIRHGGVDVDGTGPRSGRHDVRVNWFGWCRREVAVQLILCPCRGPRLNATRDATLYKWFAHAQAIPQSMFGVRSDGMWKWVFRACRVAVQSCGVAGAWVRVRQSDVRSKRKSESCKWVDRKRSRLSSTRFGSQSVLELCSARRDATRTFNWTVGAD